MQKESKHYLLPTEALESDVVILANGDYPSHPLPLAILQQAKVVVCCDGAANTYIEKGFTPHIIIGDGDSLDKKNKAKFAHIIHHSPDTETNDLTKAVNYCLSQGMTRICILGATGKREDHTIGNISLLTDYADIVDEVVMITDYGVFTPIQTDASFESYPGQAVSIFLFSATPLKAHGLEYPLSTFSKLWQGTLNKATEKQFTILTEGKILVFRAFA